MQSKDGRRYSLLMHQRLDLKNLIRQECAKEHRQFYKVTGGSPMHCAALGCGRMTTTAAWFRSQKKWRALCLEHLTSSRDTACFITDLCARLVEQFGTDTDLVKMYEWVRTVASQPYENSRHG